MRSITRTGVTAVVAGSMALAGIGGAVSAQDDPIEVAYMSASSANTWLQASRAEIERIAEENGIVVTEFDAQFDADLQTTQLQDVIAASAEGISRRAALQVRAGQETLVKRVEAGDVQLYLRNPKLCTPRDFDYSPYFDIIKCPHLEFSKNASYRNIPWDSDGRICNRHGDCFVPDAAAGSEALVPADGYALQTNLDDGAAVQPVIDPKGR